MAPVPFMTIGPWHAGLTKSSLIPFCAHPRPRGWKEVCQHSNLVVNVLDEPEHLWFPLAESLSSAAITDDGTNFMPLAQAIAITLNKNIDEKIAQIQKTTSELDDIQDSLGIQDDENKNTHPT